MRNSPHGSEKELHGLGAQVGRHSNGLLLFGRTRKYDVSGSLLSHLLGKVLPGMVSKSTTGAEMAEHNDQSIDGAVLAEDGLVSGGVIEEADLPRADHFPEEGTLLCLGHVLETLTVNVGDLDLVGAEGLFDKSTKFLLIEFILRGGTAMGLLRTRPLADS
jgi:hypothetical protein